MGVSGPVRPRRDARVDLLSAGLAREPHRYLNTYPATWMSGAFAYQRATFDHGELHELDAGFEFYAPQTTQAEDGRRILIGWMGVPDGEEMLQPTRAHGWIHQMTCPRELRYRDGRLWQTPVRELETLRETECQWQGAARGAPVLDATSLEFELETACECGFCRRDAPSLMRRGCVLNAPA